MRTSVRQALSPVKDQKDRPTCVAFAMTALHEAVCIGRNGSGPGAGIALSEEFLFYHCKGRDGLRQGVTGTTMSAAAASLGIEGQALEALCPYRTSSAHVGPVAPSAAAIADARNRLLSGLRQTAVALEALEASLRNGNPVVGVLDWYSNSYLAPSGWIDMPRGGDRLLGRHAVLLVEMDDEARPGKQTIVFKNSWGVKWGDRGFGSFCLDYLISYGRELWTLQKR